MHESIFKSVLQSDIDLRRDLVGNILLSGTTRSEVLLLIKILPGFVFIKVINKMFYKVLQLY